MKKNQSGVSLIALVITIIVVIILAAVAFGTSTDTITNANFSNFANNIAEVQQSFDAVATTVKGMEAKNGTTRTDAQVYNYVAKGATAPDVNADKAAKAWLSRSQADALPCTEISGDVAEDVYDRKLPVIKVNTDKATGGECTYFVTRTGKVFVWPPYEYEGEFYVTDTDTVSGNIYGDFSFTLDGATVNVINGATNPLLVPGTTLKHDTSLSGADTIYYNDASTAAKPVGIETSILFDGDQYNED